MTSFSLCDAGSLSFGGGFSLSGHAYLGFDSFGINKYGASGDWVDILDGLFVSTRENPDGTGPNVPEIVATT